jgi:hypothetical protein
MRIRTKPVHEALTRLLDDLGKADLTGLGPRLSGDGISSTREAWIDTLRSAQRDLEAWCPDPDGPDQFTIDVPPKS